MICDVSGDTDVRAGSYIAIADSITNLPSCDVHSTDGMWHGEALKYRNRMCDAVPRIENDTSCPT